MHDLPGRGVVIGARSADALEQVCQLSVIRSAAWGGGELEGQHVEVRAAEVHLPLRGPAVHVGLRTLRSGWYGLVAV